MLLADCIARTSGGSNAAEAQFRAGYFDLCIAHVAPYQVLMRSIKPAIKLLEYTRPTRAISWTDYFLLEGGASTAEVKAWHVAGGFTLISDPRFRQTFIAGVVRHVNAANLDGIFVDTPFETAGNPWHVPQFIDELQAGLGTRMVVVNFGDAETWARGHKTARATAAITKFPFVEVWLDVNRYDIVQLSRRLTDVRIAIELEKRPIIGFWDEGGGGARIAADVMESMEGPVHFFYKNAISKPDVRDWQVNPEVKR